MDFPLSQADALDMRDGRFTDGVPGLFPASIIPSKTTNDLIDEFRNVFALFGIVPDENNVAQLAEAFQKVMNMFSPKHSLSAGLPTENIGPIVVAETGETWLWTDTAYYTGYRHPHCGRPVAGHTVTPLPSEIDATGGLVPKASYPQLWAYARENGLVVTQAVWSANIGAHWFVDADANNFRVPDLRHQFIRLEAGANDADTANVRPLGSRQGHALGSHQHAFKITDVGYTGGGDGSNGFLVPATGGTTANTAANGSAETRPQNTAYYARIHV